MATWAELERNAPALADAGRKLIYQFGQMGLAFLATVRRDGAPRLELGEELREAASRPLRRMLEMCAATVPAGD